MAPHRVLLPAATLFALCNLTPHPIRAADLTLATPLDYQVIQRSKAASGTVTLAGTVLGLPSGELSWAARIGADHAWQPLQVERDREGGRWTARLGAPAGGWWRVEVRVMAADGTEATAAVDHVGVGEVFVVAGQSNSANHGEERQRTATGRVAAFDGQRWQIANDPQPGASGGGGSFMPPLGDQLVERLGVPVGFIACGIGATSVREWLPKGDVFAQPPTLEGRVEKLPDGQWRSKGEAFANLVARMKGVGPDGFRAVLWHQGESDANQSDPSRTLPGRLYREDLERVIRASRREIGWEAPWFVAQASYHIPGDEGSPDIRAAQASLWRDGTALEGPDSDALKGTWRENGGKGVHFSGPGLREHGRQWAAKVGAWVERQTKPGSGG